MESLALISRLKWIGWGFLIFLVLLLAFNFQYFAIQLGYFYRYDLLGQDLGHAEPNGKPDRIVINRIGVDAPLIYPDVGDESAIQLALEAGVAHYPGTAQVGQSGNAYFLGHSSESPSDPGQFKTVFALLTQLREGDKILITDSRGRQFSYQIFDRAVVSPGQTNVLDPILGHPRMLSLQTSYPLGTTLWRYIVRAELVTNK
ncbi:MAG: sortase [bacterium]